MLVALLVGRAASAEPQTGAVPVGPATHELRLHAGTVDLDGSLTRLHLADQVELRVHRYWLAADELMLERTARGIEVEGQGRIALCPCADPPVTLGFSRVVVAPPTDLLLTNATCRVGSVPIAWVPVLWLRSPHRFGLLGPQFAVRGQDGPWVGAGVHVPIAGSERPGSEVMDWRVGAYAAGGWDISTQWAAHYSTSYLRWDWLDQSLWHADARGRTEPGDLDVAWRVDGLRGARALRGPVPLEVASRRTDRARVEWFDISGPSLASLGIAADGPRGAESFEGIRAGPRIRWTVGTGLSDFGHVQSSTLLATDTRPQQNPEPTLIHRSDLGFAVRPAWLVLEAQAHQHWFLHGVERELTGEGRWGADVRVGAPFVRRFGAAHDDWGHWLEPYAQAASAWEPSTKGAVQAGLRNVLGESGGDRAVSFEAGGGRALGLGRDRGLFISRLSASDPYLGLGGDVGWVGSAGWFSSARARLGRVDALALSLKVEGRDPGAFEAAGWLVGDYVAPAPADWYRRSGWAGSADATIAATQWLAAGAGIDYDWMADTWVGERLGAVYRHPCGCLAVSTIAERRRGRDGWDAMATVDLMP